MSGSVLIVHVHVHNTCTLPIVKEQLLPWLNDPLCEYTNVMVAIDHHHLAWQHSYIGLKEWLANCILLLLHVASTTESVFVKCVIQVFKTITAYNISQ